MTKQPPPIPKLSLWQAFRMRLKRRRLLWRSFRSRHALSEVVNRTKSIRPDDVLVFMTQRNEAERLPYFLQYYRQLGVSQFLVVDNGSDDGSFELLKDQPDVSLWQTHSSYRKSRFGVDWLNWLLMRYGHGHWCLTVDADELLVFAGCDSQSLPQLTASLESSDQQAFGALMLEVYPDTALGEQTYIPGQDPTEVLRYMDTGSYRAVRQSPLGNLWVQGGVRERVFFRDQPQRSPTLNKLPLVRWNRRYAYVNSTHSILPRRLNQEYDGPGDQRPCGVIIHTKFLPSIVEKSGVEKQRGEHFGEPKNFESYYDQIAKAPNLWNDASVEYEGWRQLVEVGLMSDLQR